jgi:acetylornithine deacetylase/succinyl-diaminopimelate desuccinylase-like protein
MKGGIAAMLHAYMAVATARSKPTGSVTVAFVADEESGNAGTRRLLEQDQEWTHVVIGEPTELSVAVGHRGVARAVIMTHGRACHASTPDRGSNAIYSAAPVIQRIQAYQEELSRREATELGRPTAALTTIAGGSKDNVIPADCAMSLNRRTIVGETAATVTAEVNEMLSEFGVGSAVSFDLESFLPACWVGLDSPLALAAAEAVQDIREL